MLGDGYIAELKHGAAASSVFTALRAFLKIMLGIFDAGSMRVLIESLMPSRSDRNEGVRI